MSEPLLAEVVTVANGRPSGHAVQTLRVFLGQSKQDLATATSYSRKNVERWELGDEAIPTRAWDVLVDLVNQRLASITKQRGAR